MESPKAWLAHIKQRKEAGELCGAAKELRPYGPKGEWVCFDCGMKDPAEVARQFRRTFGISDH